MFKIYVIEFFLLEVGKSQKLKSGKIQYQEVLHALLGILAGVTSTELDLKERLTSKQSIKLKAIHFIVTIYQYLAKLPAALIWQSATE